MCGILSMLDWGGVWGHIEHVVGLGWGWGAY